MALRATRQFVEVLANGGAGTARVTRQFVEVLSVYSDAIEKTVSQGLVFSQDTNIEFSTEVEQGLVFSQEAESDVLLEIVSQSLQFGDAGAVSNRSYNLLLSQGFSFSQSSGQNLYTSNISQDLNFSQIAVGGIPVEPIIEQGLVFSQISFSNFATFTQGLIFSQTAAAGKIIPGGIERTATSGLIFEDNSWKTLILVDAEDLSASNNLIFKQFAGFPIEEQIPHAIIFAQLLEEEFDRLVEQDFSFTDSVDFNHEAVRLAENSLIFTHAFVFEDDENTCYYDPKVGAGNIPGAPTPPSVTPPVLVPQDHVTLFYPTSSPTLEIEIRAPNLGDRDRLTNDRIERESRGGTLQIFADPTWPKLQVLALQFTALTETEALTVQSFFVNTLGKTVGFTDWEGRTWHGVVMTPDEPFVRSRRNIVDIAFEFEGELQ